jgi:phosphoserine phosphatase
MTHVLTLVAPTNQPILDGALIRAAMSLLPAAAEPVWLNDRIAVDIPFTAQGAIDNRELGDAVRRELGDAPVDVFAQPLAHRRKKLFLADMDSTMIGQECIDELADFVGKKAEVAEITERTMRGELVFETSLKARVALLAGLSADVVATVIEQRIKLTPGGTELVRTMRKHGAYTALVSGGFTVFTREIAATIGFDENRANTLIVDNAKFTGHVTEPILGREAKLETLLELRNKLGLVKEDTMAVGDGANDLSMIGEAGVGVAFHAKPAVAAAAGYRIDHGDLSALLYAQGYKRAEFA